ncbi:MAG: hypothetical protein V2B18_00800, partial [Pseudomonadota bacterium]
FRDDAMKWLWAVRRKIGGWLLGKWAGTGDAAPKVTVEERLALEEKAHAEAAEFSKLIAAKAFPKAEEKPKPEEPKPSPAMVAEIVKVCNTQVLINTLGMADSFLREQMWSVVRAGLTKREARAHFVDMTVRLFPICANLILTRMDERFDEVWSEIEGGRNE